MYDSPLIAAIATPVGAGGIAIVRLSGPGAWALCRRLFRPAAPLDWEHVSGYTLHYGHIVDGSTVFDEVLLALMREGASYTLEEMAEIHCHGGVLASRRVLELLLRSGAALAAPGEFTKRAFLSGRLTLSQAEGVRETIEAATGAALEQSLSRLDGGGAKAVEELGDRLRQAAAEAEVVIDFPEDGLDEETTVSLAGVAQRSLDFVEHEIARAEQGRIYREGVRCALVGRANVGKSSLLNALLQCERAIVTPEAGTTRDTIEETVVLRRIPLVLIDTAGIRQAEGEVEARGVERSREAANSAGLIFFVFDGHEGYTPEDAAIYATLAGKPVIALANKCDLSAGPPPPFPALAVSAQQGEGLDALAETVEQQLLGSGGELAAGEWVGNLRHRDSFLRAAEGLRDTLAAAEAGMPLDLQLVGLYDAIHALDEIGGRSVSEDILDRIFRDFCIGK